MAAGFRPRTTPAISWALACGQFTFQAASNSIPAEEELTRNRPRRSDYRHVCPRLRGAPQADIRRGKRQKLTVTAGVAFTLTAPATNYDGAEKIWEVFNNSGGAIGAIAVNANHLLTGAAAFVGPGNGKRRVIAFGYDSTPNKWIELYRTTADT